MDEDNIVVDKEEDELVEGQANMMEEEIEELEAAVKPVKLVLAKVCQSQ